MFFMTPQGEVVSGTRTVQLECANCGNVADHMVWKHPHGPQLGTVFSRTKTVGMKKYFLVCSICRAASKELTKDQALAMRVQP